MTAPQRQAADILWKAIVDVRNVIAESGSGKGSNFHKTVGDLLAAKIEGDKTGEKEDNENALDDALLCLLRSNNLPLEVRVVVQPNDMGIENINVVVALTAEEAEEAGLALMAKEAIRIMTEELGEVSPGSDTIRQEFSYNKDTDAYRWGGIGEPVTEGTELLLMPVDETVVSFRPAK